MVASSRTEDNSKKQTSPYRFNEVTSLCNQLIQPACCLQRAEMSGVGLVWRHTPSQTDAQHHVWIDHGFTNGSVVFPAQVWTGEKKQWLPHDVYLRKHACCLISTLSQSLRWSFYPSSHPTSTHLSYKTARRWGISVSISNSKLKPLSRPRVPGWHSMTVP